MPGERPHDSGAGPGGPLGPEWVVMRARAHAAPRPPTPAPTGASGARSAVWAPLSRVAGCTGITLPVPTHPYHTPVVHPSPHRTVDSTADVDGVRGAVQYDRFEGAVGEPRGMGTHHCFRVLDWFMDLGLVYTAV